MNLYPITHQETSAPAHQSLEIGSANRGKNYGQRIGLAIAGTFGALAAAFIVAGVLTLEPFLIGVGVVCATAAIVTLLVTFSSGVEWRFHYHRRPYSPSEVIVHDSTPAPAIIVAPQPSRFSFFNPRPCPPIYHHHHHQPVVSVPSRTVPVASPRPTVLTTAAPLGNRPGVRHAPGTRR